MPTFAVNLYALIAAAVVTLGSLGYAAYEHQRAERYQVEKKSATDEVTRLTTSIDSKDGVITDLRDALTGWQVNAKEQTDRADDAAKKLAASEQTIADKQQSIAKLREKDNASPNCIAFLATDINGYCAGRVAGLRLAAGSGLQGSPDTRANPGDSKAGQQPH